MITKVEAISPQGEILSLPLQDVSGGYLVRDIEGLDPVKASIVSSNFATQDGSMYQASRRDNRNVVIKMGFQPDYVTTDTQSLRRNLYRWFRPKAPVTLRFYVDEVHFADISGRVESLEATPFAKDPTANISIICFDPDFIAPDSVVLSGETTANATESVVEYEGTEETGIVFRLMVDRSITGFTIDSNSPGLPFQNFEFYSQMLEGDILEISTVTGSKRAVLTRNGVAASILYGVAPSSAWLSLNPGANNFRVNVDGDPIPFTIEYRARYGGI